MKQLPFWNLTAGRIPFGNRPDALSDSTLTWDDATGTLGRTGANKPIKLAPTGNAVVDCGSSGISASPTFNNSNGAFCAKDVSGGVFVGGALHMTGDGNDRFRFGLRGPGVGTLTSDLYLTRLNGSWDTALFVRNSDGVAAFGTDLPGSNGRVQVAAHTTKAGGYGVASDTSFFRSGTNTWSTDTGGAIRSDGFFPTGAGINEKLAFGSGYLALFGSGNELRWNGTEFFPVTAGARDLGKAANRWRNLYVGGIDASGDIGCGNIGCGDINAAGAVRLTQGAEANGGGTGTLVVTGGIESSGNMRAGGFIVANGGFYVGGTYCLSGQGAAVANATGAGDVVAQLNALLASLRGNKVIAP
jgi:hypothetical protein